MTSYVDWEFAKTAGARLVSAGPRVSPERATEEVEAIREAAAAAREPVAATSRLTTTDAGPPARIVDRPGWIAANADSMGAMLDPAFEQIMSKRPKERPAESVVAVGSKITGAEAGGLLAFMASKVLGQYDLAPHGEPTLLLVAPNILAIAEDLDVDQADFRNWVCMHEETHRVQFTAVPWLREHMIGEARGLAVDLAPDPQQAAELLKRFLAKLPELFSSASAGITDLFTTPEQRDRVAQVTAVMSLLEGHADVVMDEVGPSVIPSVAQIRAKFTEHRNGAGAVDRLLRRLLGLEAKMRQYRDGAEFVRAVQAKVGVDGFNAVWTSPETLPLPAEIPDPTSWVRRVHG